MTRPVHILLPVHNRREITRDCLKQLIVQTHPVNVVVIDDGSSDGTATMVKEVAPAATVLRGNGNLWWAGSLQLGLNHLVASGTQKDDILLLLNDDTSFDMRFIESAVTVMKDYPDCMVLAQAFSLQTGEFIELGARVDWQNLRFDSVPDITQVNCLSTRGLFIRLHNVLRVGSFRPRLLPHYLSDYEFTIRALRRGVRPVTDPSVRLYLNEHTTGQHIPDKTSPGAYVRSVITNRSAVNPIHWTLFVMLACPLRYLPRNLYRVWMNFLRNLREAWHYRRAAPL
jgi:GT2 family glycosyltransferase